MNLIELKTFLTVIEEKGITAAAIRLNLTQPAVSKRLDNLKHSFGIKSLFNRTSGNLEVSKDAQILIPYAKNIVALAENAKNEVNNHTKGTKGKIYIGTGASWTLTVLPAAIATTLKKFPELLIDLNVDIPDTQLKKLSNNKIDILFARKPTNLEFYDYKPIRVDSFIVISSSDHPLSKKQVSFEDLSNYKWTISTTAKQTQELFFNLFNSRGLPKPIISLSTNSLNMALNSLLKSDLLLFTTINTLESFKSNLFSRVNINNFEISRETGVITRKGYKSVFFENLMLNLKEIMPKE
ncbi:LysR family transcriptional regulator [Alphaproteobacteria bacterium]|nr:LysR family transcriptional regulator [Alphaproteobacteria bacterium]